MQATDTTTRLADWKVRLGEDLYNDFEDMAAEQAWESAEFGKPTQEDVDEILIALLDEYGDKY